MRDIDILYNHPMPDEVLRHDRVATACLDAGGACSAWLAKIQ